jgi:hypothetical protein
MDLNNIKFSGKVNLDLNTVAILYRHYKDYAIPVVVILLSVLILFFIVNPQINQYLSSQDQLKTQTQKLQVLKNNYSFLTNMDDARSDADISSLSKVLPLQKDFVSSMNAISYAASKTGVAVGNFQVNVGDLAKDDNPTGITVITYPFMQIQIDLGGNADAIFQFINVLYKTAPIAEISKIKFDQGTATLVINFYYKQYSLKNVSGQSPIVPFSAQKENIIKEVSAWNNDTSQIDIPSFLPINESSSSSVIIASPAASTNGSPF